MGRVWAAVCVLGVVGCGGASGSNVRQLGGILTVTPANLDFGDVALGKEQSHAITLRNDGIVPLTVDATVALVDPAFEVEGLPVTLGAGEKTDLRVRYRPPTLGVHARTIGLSTDSNETGPAQIDLRGNAVRGLVQLSGDSFDFGNVVVNETATQDLLLTNNDGHAETSVAIVPPSDPTAFSVAPPGEQPVGAEQSMVVTIQFRPDHIGSYASAVMVTPCPTCSPRSINLTGQGVDRLLVVQPATIDFGEVKLGGDQAQPFTVTNTSRSPLVVTSIALSGSAELTAALDNAQAPLTLAPGQTVNGTAHFRPKTLGAQTAQATMTASDGGPAVLAMSGFAMGPVLQVTPKALVVGPTAIGTTRTGTLTVTNVGLDPGKVAPLNIQNVSIVSNDPAWSLVTGMPLAVGEPGASAGITVSFSPQTPGLSQATLVIDSNDPLHPQVQVPMAATGRDLLPCTLSMNPSDPVNFGLQKLFVPTVEGFELINTTADDCIVGDPVIVSGGPAFRWPGGIAPSGRTLAPGGRMSVRLEFVAEQAQTYWGVVQFYVSNKAAQMKTVNLVGAGDASCFYLSPPTVDFGATTLSCNVPDQFVYAVNQCSFPVTVTAVETSGAPFSASAALPLKVQPFTHAGIQIGYAPTSRGDDVGAVRAYTDMRPEPFQSGITGGAQPAATIFDQWDQSTPKVDMLIVIDNSGSMAEEQHALATNLDHLWNRIALANADFHIAVTTTGMYPYTAGWTQCPGGASGGEAGRFFPVDNSRPRMLTPQTPDVKNVLFANTNVGTCHYDERFLDPVTAALTAPLISSTKAPGTPWPADGNAGFLRDDARLALMAVSDADDANDVVNPPPVSDYVNTLKGVKHGALDLISFAGIVPLRNCATVEQVGTRYMELARELNGHLEDICDLNNFGTLLENSLGTLLLPLSSFPLSAIPKDPTAIVVTVNGAVVTDWTYDAGSNRIVFPATDVPAPGSHITAKYEPACQ